LCETEGLKKQSFILEGVYADATDGMGRGMFTKASIRKKTIIEIAPVIVMSAEDRIHIDKTLLHDYIFEWGEGGKDCCMALGYVPLYNHSYRSNCEYEMHFSQQLIVVRAVRSIKEGEELFINYNGDWNNDERVWFHK
jgi:SET domain-containing protein